MVGGILSDDRHARATDPRRRSARWSSTAWAGTGKFHDVDVAVRPRRDRRPVRACRLRRLGDRGLHLRHRPADQRPRSCWTASAIAPRSPRHAQQLGIALLPANRKLRGHVLVPVDRLQHLRRPSAAAVAGSALWIDRGRETHRRQGHDQAAGGEDAAASGSRSARCPAATRRRWCWPANSSSGPRLLVLAEPTQGVDVGAKEEIHRIITELADERHRGAGGDLRSAGGAADLRPAAGRPRRHHDRRVRTGRHAGRRARRGRRRRRRARDGAAPDASPSGPRPTTGRLTEPANRRRRAARPAHRVLPSPVTGQELVLIGVHRRAVGRSWRSRPRRSSPRARSSRCWSPWRRSR